MKVYKNKFVTILILLFNVIGDSLQYKQLHVENQELCSLIKKRKIKLGTGDYSALIVNQTRLNKHNIKWDKNMYCNFQVSVHDNREGIFAVIQQLIFRINSTTDQCIDYIQFRAKDGTRSQKYCGRFNAELKMDYYFINGDNINKVFGNVDNNTFVDIRGAMDVEIFVSKERLSDEEETDLNIVFTAYKRCSELYIGENKAPCDKKHADVCIDKSFLRDGIINCPYPGCVDEGGCSFQSNALDDSRTSLGDKILMGSISSLVILFAVFILCIWSCRKHKVLCWAETFANPASNNNAAPPSEQPPQHPRVMELTEQTGSRLSQPQRSNQTSVQVVEEDKDLPPSYDSLFPSR